MTSIFKTVSAAAFAIAIAGTGMALSTSPAEAKIRCAGPNQVTKYGLISSSYCEDVYLAKISGYHPKAMLYNPKAKDAACDAVGHDTRVAHLCQGHGFRGDGRDWN